MSELLQEKLNQAAKELEIILADLLQKIDKGEDI